jgi:hypothetical protein
MDLPTSCNLVVLVGTIVNGVASRPSPEHPEFVTFDVAARPAEGGPAARVPVAWFAPDWAQVARLGPGDRVVVVGEVRRRFFSADGRRGSLTEVIADEVVPARQVKRALGAVRAALGGLDVAA